MRVIILNGPIASGKNTVGPIVAKELHAAFVDLDASVFEANPRWLHESDSEKQRAWRAGRKLVSGKIAEAIRNNQDVVMVGPLYQGWEIRACLGPIPSDTEVFLFTLEVPLQTRIGRANVRNRSQTIEELVQQDTNIRELEAKFEFAVDNTGPPDETAAKILSNIQLGLGALPLTNLYNR